MTRARRVPPPMVAPIPPAISAAEREELIRLRQKDHDRNTEPMRQMAMDRYSKPSDTPLWLKITGAGIAASLGALALLAVVFNRGAAEQALVFRLDMLERTAADRDRERDRAGDNLRSRVLVLEQANQQSSITDARTDSSLRGIEQALKSLGESLGGRLERIERQRGTSFQSAPPPAREEPTLWRLPLRFG